jgi:hypothetical protein
VSSAAYLNPAKASVVVPILLAVFIKASEVANDRLIRNPKPARPAAPTKAVRIENTAPVTFFNPEVTVPKPFLVLSNALIVIFTFSAIVLTHYLEISQPFVKVIDRHLLCFCNGKVEAVSQGKQIHP